MSDVAKLLGGFILGVIAVIAWQQRQCPPTTPATSAEPISLTSGEALRGNVPGKAQLGNVPPNLPPSVEKARDTRNAPPPTELPWPNDYPNPALDAKPPSPAPKSPSNPSSVEAKTSSNPDAERSGEVAASNCQR